MDLKNLLYLTLIIFSIVGIFAHPISEHDGINEKYIEIDKYHSNISPRKSRQAPGGFGGLFQGFGGLIPSFLGSALGAGLGGNFLGNGGLGSALGGGGLGGLGGGGLGGGGLGGLGGGGLGGGGLGGGGLGGAGANPGGFGQLFNLFGQSFGNAFGMGLQGFFGGLARPGIGSPGGQSAGGQSAGGQSTGITTNTAAGTGNIPISSPTAILPDPITEPILSSGYHYHNQPGFNNYNRGGPYNYYNRGPYNYGPYG